MATITSCAACAAAASDDPRRGAQPDAVRLELAFDGVDRIEHGDVSHARRIAATRPRPAGNGVLEGLVPLRMTLAADSAAAARVRPLSACHGQGDANSRIYHGMSPLMRKATSRPRMCSPQDSRPLLLSLAAREPGMTTSENVTQLLVAWSGGDADSPRCLDAADPAGAAPAGGPIHGRGAAGTPPAADRSRQRGLPSAGELEGRAVAEPCALLRDRRPDHAPRPRRRSADARAREARARARFTSR